MSDLSVRQANPSHLGGEGVLRPTTDSEGRPLQPTEEGIRNFWRWFGDSKAVDAEGRPLVVYRGTGNSFSKFDRHAYTEREGFYFTSDPRFASDFAESSTDGIAYGEEEESQGPSVMPAYLTIKNLVDVRDGWPPEIAEQLDDVINYEWLTTLPPSDFWLAMDGDNGAAIKTKLENLGYDGLLATEVGASVYVAFHPEQIKSAAGNVGAFDSAERDILLQAAYHGTPHRGIDKFSTDFIGTGEGQQSFGWGLYFADRREIAEHYRNKLASAQSFDPAFWENVELPADLTADEYRELLALRQKLNANAYRNGPDLTAEESSRWRELKDKEDARAAAIEAARSKGQLYEVDIPEDSEMLLWDKPLSEQPEKVREALAGVIAKFNPYFLERQQVAIDKMALQLHDGDTTAERLYRELSRLIGKSDQITSKLFANLGIKGIKYLDGTSRSAGEGSYNYVIFSGDDVVIRDQFYQGARGAYDISSMTTVLTGTADASTFVHESGHFFLDALRRLSKASPEVARLHRSALEALGVAEADWERWHLDYHSTGRIAEGMRAAHERWAESFEAYVASGKAPSADLSALFEIFREWLSRVAVSLACLLGSRGEGVAPRLRSVMDNLFVTDDGAVGWGDAEEIVHRMVRADLAESLGLEPDAEMAEHGARMVTRFLAAMAKHLRQPTDELYKTTLPHRIVRPDGHTKDSLHQFAGPQAATADLRAMAYAKERLEAGQSPERVRVETGWFKGVDGRWRFEISDDEARFRHQPPVSMAEVEAGLGDSISVGPDHDRGKPNELFKATYGEGSTYRGTFGRTPEDARANLIRLLAKERNAGSFVLSEARRYASARLGEVLHHPRLFDAYPDLAGLTVVFLSDKDFSGRQRDFKGAYHRQSRQIDLVIGEEIGQSEEEAILSTLLHEVQHAIQHHEGFARGGNASEDFVVSVKASLSRMAEGAKESVEAWRRRNSAAIDAANESARAARFARMWQSSERLIRYSASARPSGLRRLILREMDWMDEADLRDNEEAESIRRRRYGIPKPHRMAQRNAYLSTLAFDAAQIIRSCIPEDVLARFKDDDRGPDRVLAAARRASDRAARSLEPLRDLKRVSTLAAEVVETHKVAQPHRIYRALAGEVEARNTQTRRSMNDVERSSTNPAHTADVPLGETIVMFDDMEAHAPCREMREEHKPRQRPSERVARRLGFRLPSEVDAIEEALDSQVILKP